jgi:tetratricopeptide (TPR) repeat protein
VTVLGQSFVSVAKAQTGNSSSHSVDVLFDRANKLDLDNKYEEAVPYYDRILAINSTNTDAMFAIANDLDQLQRHEEAVPYYDRILAINASNIYAMFAIANDLDQLQRGRRTSKVELIILL